jgi:hypothetical protein
VTKKTVILAILLLTACLAKADSLETLTFVFPGIEGTFKNVPLDVFPTFSAINTSGVQWNFNFVQGDTFIDVQYASFSDYSGPHDPARDGEVSPSNQIPVWCDGVFNPGCVPQPWPLPLSISRCCINDMSRASGSGFFPGDFGFVIITESALTTPEPSTLWLLGVGCVGCLLALLWSRKNMSASNSTVEMQSPTAFSLLPSEYVTRSVLLTATVAASTLVKSWTRNHNHKKHSLCLDR